MPKISIQSLTRDVVIFLYLILVGFLYIFQVLLSVGVSNHWRILELIKSIYDSTVRKVSRYGFFMIRIFPYSDWIRRFTSHLDTFYAALKLSKLNFHLTFLINFVTSRIRHIPSKLIAPNILIWCSKVRLLKVWNKR